MNRAQRQAKIAEMHESFREAELVVITHQQGLTVAEATELRRRMREAGARFRVTKNRLARIALGGTQFEPLADLFTGPTAVAYSDDPVTAAKAVVEFAKKSDKLTIVGGGLSGQVLDQKAVEALTTLPSLEELRAKLVGLLQAPATRLAGVLTAPAGDLARIIAAPGGQLAGVIRARVQKGEAA